MFSNLFISFILISRVLYAAVEGAKCMSRDDARYVTTKRDIPDSWKVRTDPSQRIWHEGDYIANPEHRDSGEIGRSFHFTAKEDSARLWLYKVQDEANLYFILTRDAQHVLCTVSKAGLQIDWLPATSDAMHNGYCHWEVTLNEDNQDEFMLRNAELLQEMPDIGAVYWNRTGVYFDYVGNYINNQENEIHEWQRWWKWEKFNDNQRDINEIDNICAEGFDPMNTDNDLIITSRSVGGGESSSSRFSYTSLSAKCGRKWFLYKRNCYRIFTSPALIKSRADQVCKYFGGHVVLTEEHNEHTYIRRLIKKYGRNLQYWLGTQYEMDEEIGTMTYLDDHKKPLHFTKWKKHSFRSSTKDSLNCAVMSGGMWIRAGCDRRYNVLCKRPSIPLGDAGNCGKIQVEEVDTLMKSISNPRTPGQDRIIGGEGAHPGQFPWQAAIRFKVGKRISGYDGLVFHNCGGTLIDKCWVLSAAHCFRDANPNNYEVRLGDLFKLSNDGTEQTFDVELIIKHEDYKEVPSARNDVALVKLAKKSDGRCATLNEAVQAACLPTNEWDIREEGEQCQVSGWGVTDYEKGQKSASDRLMYATLPTLSNSLCGYRYNRSGRNFFVEDVMMCAGFKRGGQDSCSGDSGGPYVCRNTNNKYAVMGIVSFGVKCAHKRYPGVYARVTTFVPWIAGQVRSHGDAEIIV